MSNKQCPEDVAAFKRIIEADPENKKCFECAYPHPLWCNINHGVFICMECSGVHRGLGVHLSFVRSATIDDWTAWRPEKLKQMEIGGNRKARLFFERHGVPKQPIRARYEHNGALMYKDKLEAEAMGKPFDESTWQVPEWKTRMMNNNNTIGSSGIGSGGGNNNRFQGIGSGGQGSNSNNSGGAGDWFGAISDGWGKVASVTTELATVTTKSVKEAALQEKAAESATWAWGNLTSYASAIGKLATEATTNITQQIGVVAGGGGEDDDGLGGLTRNVERVAADSDRFQGIEHKGAPVRSNDDDDDDGLSALTRNVAVNGGSSAANNERFKGIEHKAERSKNDGWGGGDEDGDGWGGGGGSSNLRSLAGNLPKTNKYQGVGSSDSNNIGASPATKVSPNSNTPAKAAVAASPSPSQKKDGWDDWDNNDDFE